MIYVVNNENIRVNNVVNMIWYMDTLWLFNMAMEAMAHRWFMVIYLSKMVIFHGYVKKERVYSIIYIYMILYMW